MSAASVGLRYYRRHSLRFGEWKREWSELITDRKIIREFRQDGTPMIRSDKTPIPSSPVNRLFAALIRQFASDLPKGERACPKEVSASEWEFNAASGRSGCWLEKTPDRSVDGIGSSQKARARWSLVRRLPDVFDPGFSDKRQDDHAGAAILR